jgi:tRNA (Thr-GGU) A37 N-methylase
MKNHEMLVLHESCSKLFRCVSVFHTVRIERKRRRKEKVRKKNVCSVNIYQLRNVRVLSQNIIINQSFNDSFQRFSRVHHLIIIEMFDILSHFVFIAHQRTEHNHMFDNLSISVTTTRRSVNLENLTTM